MPNCLAFLAGCEGEEGEGKWIKPSEGERRGKPKEVRERKIEENCIQTTTGRNDMQVIEKRKGRKVLLKVAGILK